jgi:hypothetical protein
LTFIAHSRWLRKLTGEERKLKFAQARANAAAGTLPMIPTARVRREIEESAGEEAPEHEWAEYNLPFALLPGLPGDDDNLAFLGLGTDIDAELPDGSS